MGCCKCVAVNAGCESPRGERSVQNTSEEKKNVCSQFIGEELACCLFCCDTNEAKWPSRDERWPPSQQLHHNLAVSSLCFILLSSEALSATEHESPFVMHLVSMLWG